MKVLVTGATGYIGGRLVPRLLNEGYQVRVFARNPARLEDHPWSDRVERVAGDVFDGEVLARALDGVEAAYYLIHAMCSGPDWAERDRRAATLFVEAAGDLEQIVYLGGILPDSTTGRGSEHLRSRAEVGEILRRHPGATEFRAGPIIGSGSASFEMVRYLTERLPAMLTPSWVRNLVQPIGVRHVLEYLVGVLGRTDATGVIDIGSEVLTFKEMMQGYAEVRGLPRAILPLSVMSPRVAGFWVGLVTPIPNCLAIPLVEGMARPVVGDLTRARELFPEVRPAAYKESVELALLRIHQGDIKTSWRGSVGRKEGVVFQDTEGLVRQVRTRLLDIPVEAVFRAFTSLGGERGWLAWEWAWEARGILDQLVGGPGIRRGRRHPQELRTGDAVDFWRVEEIEENRLLRLVGEMRVPGRAWLQFEVDEVGGRTRLVQAALFEPRGFWGWAYWYSLSLAHTVLFDRMIDAVAELAREMAAEDAARSRQPHPPA
jgi:uncharacterized protein YbjT (DUF2867 family)